MSGDLLYPERLLMMRDINSNKNKDTISDNDNKNMGVSAVDLHCLWYPTVQRTVMRLNNLFKCLDVKIYCKILFN